MRSALKIRILLIILIHTLCSVTVIGANLQSDVPLAGHSLSLQKEKVDPLLEATHIPSEEDTAQITKDALPLVKVAHSNVIDLLHLFFVSKPIHVPIYTPFLQQIGLRINWFECLQNFWDSEKKSYGAGVDFHFCGPIQLALDIGYLADQPKDIVYHNRLKYRSKGRYALGALLYLIHPNRLTNAYFGMGYGHSRFELITFDHTTSTSKPLVAGWIKLVGGSEVRLVPQLYGGMHFGIAYLLHGKKNDDPKVSNYSIPGYGKIVNKIMPHVTLYIKWSISFLEKR